MKQRSLGFLCAAVLTLVTACGGSDTATDSPSTTTLAANTTEIRATGFLFQPDEVTIRAGATVTWTNDDKILHTVTAGTPENPSDSFDRELDGQGSSTTIRFDQAGDYTFFCSRHPHMQGVVYVRAIP